MSQAPRWPAWTIPAVLLGALLALAAASLLAALVVVLLGADAVTPGTVVLAAAFDVAATYLVIRFVAGRAGIRLRPEHLGLTRVPPRMTLVVLGFGTAVAALAGVATMLLTGVDPAAPPDLGGDEALVTFDLATAASVFGRAVLVAVAVELVLRGFALPALAQRLGSHAAVVLLAVLGALAVDLELAPAYAAIGVALGVMFLQSGSIVPGMALQAGVHAHYFGLSVEWSVPESLALAVPAAAAAFAIGRSWDRGPRTS